MILLLPVSPGHDCICRHQTYVILSHVQKLTLSCLRVKAELSKLSPEFVPEFVYIITGNGH